MTHSAIEKTALVTGGNRGIGLAVVRALAQLDGYRVLMGCRDPAAAEATDLPVNIEPVQLELGDDNSLQRGVDDLLEAHGRIDVLVNNAGVLEFGNLLDIEPATLDEHMQVNFRAAYHLARRLVPAMVDHGYGRVVNVSSGWGSLSRGLVDSPARQLSPDHGVALFCARLVELRFAAGIRGPGLEQHGRFRRCTGSQCVRGAKDQNRPACQLANHGHLRNQGMKYGFAGTVNARPLRTC